MYELEYCPELSYGKAAELVSRLAEKGFGVTYKPEYGPEPEYCPEPSYEKAAELVSRLAELGFRQLSTNEQLQEIEELVSKYEGLGVHLQRPAELNEQSDEDFRVKAFAELFNNQKNRVTMQYYVLSDFIARFSSKEAIFWLMQLNSQDQEELINKMYDIEPRNYRRSDESQEEFIQRRFMEILEPGFIRSPRYDFALDEAKKYYLASNSNIDEMSLPAPPYVEFWVGMSSIWFQCLPVDKQRQHIRVLSAKLAFVETHQDHEPADGDVPNQIQSVDTEEDDSSRLTIFKHLFNKLDSRSQRFLVRHIIMTLDRACEILQSSIPELQAQGPFPPPDGRSLFDNELIKFDNPYSREGGGGQAPTSSTQGQGGGGGGSGTAAPTSTQGARVGQGIKWISRFFGSSA